MVCGQLHHFTLAQQIDATVTNMKKVQRAALDNHRAKGTEITFGGGDKLMTLAKQPQINRRQDLLTTASHGPGIRCLIILFEKALHRSTAGFASCFSRRYTIRQGNAYPFVLKSIRLLGPFKANRILIDRLDPRFTEAGNIQLHLDHWNLSSRGHSHDNGSI